MKILPSWFIDIYKPNVETSPATKQARTVGPEENDLDSETPFKINFTNAPRGVRNNNPGNIEVGEPWQGVATTEELVPQQKEETRFVVFKSPEFGIRAITKIIQTYRVKHGLNTVRGIINRWAPPFENNTDAYVEAVASFMGVGADDKIDTTNPKILNPLISAIIRHENGQQPYPESIIMAGISLANIKGG